MKNSMYDFRIFYFFLWGVIMEKNNIIIKGTKDGAIIVIKEKQSYEEIKNYIYEKLIKSLNFYKNSKLYIDFSVSNINLEEQYKLISEVNQIYGINLQIFNKDKKTFNGLNEGRTKFVYNTIRSGQNIDYYGNIVIIGDVNAGSHIKAGGNIIVLGTLRGIAYAGTSGNENAIIAAFSLQPTQLKISNIISRSPDGEIMKSKCPELARIKNNNIIVEPYAPNKFL